MSREHLLAWGRTDAPEIIQAKARELADAMSNGRMDRAWAAARDLATFAQLLSDVISLGNESAQPSQPPPPQPQPQPPSLPQTPRSASLGIAAPPSLSLSPARKRGRGREDAVEQITGRKKRGRPAGTAEGVAPERGTRSPEEMEERRQIGVVLQAVKEELGWTWTDMSRKVGVSAPVLSRMSGGHPDMSLDTARRTAEQAKQLVGMTGGGSGGTSGERPGLAGGVYGEASGTDAEGA